MRKSLIYILAFAFLVLTICGCSAQNTTDSGQIPTKFESDFTAKCKELEVSGHISKLETGVYTFSITAPKSLEGIKINCVGDKISTNLGDIGFETDAENLPYTAFIKAITNALDTSDNSVVTVVDGYIKYQNDNFCITQEQDSGNIVSITIKDADISINFVNFSAQ